MTRFSQAIIFSAFEVGNACLLGVDSKVYCVCRWRHLFLLITVLWKPFSFWMTVMSTMVILTPRAQEWRAGFFPSGWYARHIQKEQIWNWNADLKLVYVFPGLVMRIRDLKGCTFMFLCWNKWLQSTFWPPLQSYVHNATHWPKQKHLTCTLLWRL